MRCPFTSRCQGPFYPKCGCFKATNRRGVFERCLCCGRLVLSAHIHQVLLGGCGLNPRFPCPFGSSPSFIYSFVLVFTFLQHVMQTSRSHSFNAIDIASNGLTENWFPEKGNDMLLHIAILQVHLYGFVNVTWSLKTFHHLTSSLANGLAFNIRDSDRASSWMHSHSVNAMTLCLVPLSYAHNPEIFLSSLSDYRLWFCYLICR